MPNTAPAAETSIPPGPLYPPSEPNLRLRANVHPTGWRNPTPAAKYHLVVIGGGTGGLVTAAIAAGLGARVALMERHLMGGDCLNVGCVPSKAVLRAARAWTAAREAAERFGGPEACGDGDFAAAMERMRRIRADLSGVDSAARFRELGVDVFLGDARFTAPDAVEVNGDVLRFRRATIATGSRPRVPEIPGFAETEYLTNQTVWGLGERPARMLVIGGGPIGCELAQAFARFGTRVTLLEKGERILPHDDADAAAVVARSLERNGVEIVCGASVSSAERRGDERIVHFKHGAQERTAAAEQLLVAIGRLPNTEGMGLEEAGVRHGREGIETDGRLRTSNRRVFAVGDVASRYQFTHMADAMARLVVPNALFWARGKVGELVVPWCTYTSPELAHVGITAEEAVRRGEEVRTITIPLAEVDRARLDGETEGFLRVYLRGGSDRILGATLVAEHAGDIISQITAAMHAGTGLGKLGGTIFPYPTQAEVIRKAADQWRRGKLNPLARRVLGAFFAVFD